MTTPQTTVEAFDLFDENLKLNPVERARAEKTHREITALLMLKGLIVSAFLQGSFARKTMIAPLRDVDKIVVLHPDLDGLSPEEVMDQIEAVLREVYTNATFDRSRHALQVDFGKESFYFDTVPAWESPTDDDDVMIANRETGGWDRSNTRTLIRVVAERNKATEGVWIRQVRMAKQVIKHLLDGIIPGLHVESWAYIAVTGRMAHDVALATILERGSTLLGRTYTEPTGVEVISDRLKPDVIAAARPVLEHAAARAREARRLTEIGEHNEAIRIWHDLCGDCFPPVRTQGAGEALATAFAGGSVTSSGAVAASALGQQVNRPTRAWAPG
jgi:hypothetical protein